MLSCRVWASSLDVKEENMISQSQSIAIDIEKVQTIMKFEFEQTNMQILCWGNWAKKYWVHPKYLKIRYIYKHDCSLKGT